jgi:hypothetical protein
MIQHYLNFFKDVPTLTLYISLDAQSLNHDHT